MFRLQLLPPGSLRRWATCGLGLCLVKCLGGQTGGEVVEPVPDLAGLGCESRFVPLARGEISELGFAADEVLAVALGTRSAPLFWNPSTAPVTYSPEQGESRIELELEYQGGSVRHVSWHPPQNAGGTSVSCPADRLEIEVSARLETAGGALAETFSTRLLASTPDSASLTHAFTLDALSGSFTVSAPPEAMALTLALDATLGDQSFSGTLWGAISERSGRGGNSNSVATRAVLYAAWPTALERTR